MTPRERVQCILEHKKPDRVAVDIGSTAAGITNDTFRKVKEYLGVTSEDIVVRPDESSALYNDDVMEKLGSDFRHVFLLPPDGYDPFATDGVIRNEFGVEKKLIQGITQLSSTPLADAEIEDIDTYPWPDPYATGRTRGLKERARHLYYDTDYAIASRAVSHGFFELSWELRGMENMLVDMLVDKEFANKLLDKTLEIQMGLYDVLLSECGEYLQIVETSDDYGTQKGPIMSPELFEEMILPRRKKLNDFIKSKAPQVKIFHHTCGSVYRLLDRLIESGVDILNPVQPSADEMDTYRLQEEFGDRLIFHGSIDEQTALIFSKERVQDEMKRRLESLGKEGGYIMAPTSNFQDDMPLENIIRFAEWAKELGRYQN
ncbi:MAG: uroporphyrinogen decarboxylase family protein [Muricomes sp.]|nr:uroporphyrinogen decarboxylase family protein [Muricomes sp.]